VPALTLQCGGKREKHNLTGGRKRREETAVAWSTVSVLQGAGKRWAGEGLFGALRKREEGQGKRRGGFWGGGKAGLVASLSNAWHGEESNFIKKKRGKRPVVAAAPFLARRGRRGKPCFPSLVAREKRNEKREEKAVS